MGVKFQTDNIFFLDFDKPSLFTSDASGIRYANDTGPSNNDFRNDEAVGTRPQLASNGIAFDGGDHLRNGLGLIPSSGDWTFACRFSGTGVLFAQYVHNGGTRSIFISSSASFGFYIVNDAPYGQASIRGGTVIDGLNTGIVRRSGSEWTIHLNGEQVATYTSSRILGSHENVIGARNNVYNGDPLNALAAHLDGSIVRMGLWDRAIADGEMSSLYRYMETGQAVNIPILTGGI